MKLSKGTPVSILVPRPDVPKVKQGAIGTVVATRTDDQVLVKLKGHAWPVSFARTSLEVAS